MREHGDRIGSALTEADWMDYHRKAFDIQTLRMVFLEGRRIGFIKVASFEDGFEISVFCLEKEHQRRGIGSQILSIILHEMDVRGRATFLNVIRGNPAAKLYERFGYKIIRTDENSVYYRRQPI